MYNSSICKADGIMTCETCQNFYANEGGVIKFYYVARSEKYFAK